MAEINNDPTATNSLAPPEDSKQSVAGPAATSAPLVEETGATDIFESPIGSAIEAAGVSEETTLKGTILGKRTKAIDAIERATAQHVKIEAEETEDSLAKCHPQDQCVLFKSLPRELRDLVWAFATAPYEDKNHVYKRNEYYCRPGHTARLKTDFGLLLTCRRIWLEANALPMLQAEHCFWYHRAAPDARDPQWMGNLTAENRKHCGTIHLYAQMFAIEGLSRAAGCLRQYFLKKPREEGDFQPRRMHVTIRHTDWWYWEDESPLRFKDRWFQAMLDTPDLRSTQTLELELETLDYKVDQLMPIVERLSALQSAEYQTHIVDGEPTSTKFLLHGKPHVSTWSGPANIDGRFFHPYKARATLNYHVVTLTWRLHFPEYQHAHIPSLRLAPRFVDESDSDNHSDDSMAESTDWYDLEFEPRDDFSDDESNYISATTPAFETYHTVDWIFDPNGELEFLGMKERMMNEQVHIEKVQGHYARVLEEQRISTFTSWMDGHRARSWVHRWQEGRSLLKFED